MKLDPIPNTEQLVIKESFKEQYQKLLGTEYDAFMQCSFAYIRKTIRVNTLKISVAELKKRLQGFTLTPVPWCNEGFWIKQHEERYDIGNLPEHSLGYVYLQDAASMIPPVVLNPKPGDWVLDTCAAPGSKTTQLAQYMKNRGVLVANDLQGSRLKPLGVNLQRMGVKNTIVTRMDGNIYKRFPNLFDKILVDAPCSGTGTIRRSLKTLQMYSPGMVKKLSHVQYNLLRNAFIALKPGGTLVYSTCTLEPEENEGVITKLLVNHPQAQVEPITLDIKRHEAIKEFNGVTYHTDVKHCLRIYPQDNDSEGFFVAKIMKKNL